MSSVRLRDLLIVTAGIIVSVKGAPIASDLVGKLPGVQLQNKSLLQPSTNQELLPAPREKTARPDIVSTSTKEPRAIPSETFVKTVLRGFFEDLKKRPQLVDDIIRHEAYKELFIDPLTAEETEQLDPQTDAQPGSKDQPHVRPLAAPILTLVPILLNSGRKVEENQNQGGFIPTQEPLSVPGLKNTNSEFGISGDIENKEPKQNLPKPSVEKSFDVPSQSQPQIGLKAYSVSQEPTQKATIEYPHEENTMAPVNQQDEPHYIYSIIPLTDEQEHKSGNQGLEEDSSSTGGGCGGSSDVVDDAAASNIIYDEAPAYYYYVYYDDDDATEGEKKYPVLQDYPMPALPEMGEKFQDPLPQLNQGQPKVSQPQEPVAADSSDTGNSGEHLPDEIADAAAQKKVTSQTEEDVSKMDAVPGSSPKQKMDTPESVSLVEDDLKNLNH